jgi:hypothetical protein
MPTNTSVSFTGTCPNCGVIAYSYGTEELREDLREDAEIGLLCINCNVRRPTTTVERERLQEILARESLRATQP